MHAMFQELKCLNGCLEGSALSGFGIECGSYGLDACVQYSQCTSVFCILATGYWLLARSQETMML